MKKLWINGRASQDGEEWTEEMKAHCERCYDDKDETSQMQEERIQEQRRRRDSLEAWTGRKVETCRQSAQGPWDDDEEKGPWSE